MILLTAASRLEMSPFLSATHEAQVGLIVPIFIAGAPDMNGLISGIGSGLTGSNLSRELARRKYNLVISIGIAGSFSPNLAKGDVVLVEEERFADYGVDNRGAFESLFQIGLVNPNEFPFTNGKLLYQEVNLPILGQFQRAKGITVSTASGSESALSRWKSLYNPHIETLENAALFYSCLMAHVPFISIRSISNRVEPRSPKGWNIPLAIENLKDSTIQIIKDYQRNM